MNKNDRLPGIKIKSDIYFYADRYFEEGRLFPFIVSDLVEKYKVGPELANKLVTDAQNKHWDHLQKRVLELLLEEKTHPEIVALLTEEEPDQEVVEYIIGMNYQFYEQAVVKNPTPQPPVVETALLLITVSTILFIMYNDDALGIFKIIGWFLFIGALTGFISSMKAWSKQEDKQ